MHSRMKSTSKFPGLNPGFVPKLYGLDIGYTRDASGRIREKENIIWNQTRNLDLEKFYNDTRPIYQFISCRLEVF